jgi:putative SOS response-associated peptidase YedK
MAKKSALEEAVLAKSAPQKSKPGGENDDEPDPGNERLRRLVDDWLEMHQQQQAEEDAAFAARPDAAMLGASLKSRLEESTRREGVLWDEMWRSEPGAKPLLTCCLFTVPSNELAKTVHSRMPGIIHPNDYAVWMDRKTDDPEEVLPLVASASG